MLCFFMVANKLTEDVLILSRVLLRKMVHIQGNSQMKHNTVTGVRNDILGLNL